MTAPPIPASLATACAAHDRHRLDVLDALLDEAAPSAVRELLGAALDLCAAMRTRRDETEAALASERAHLAACRTRIAGLEQAANERSAEVARMTARVAELEARPVLTVEMLDDAMSAVGYGAAVLPGIPAQLMRHLGPVTLLPAQDRAEELVTAMYHARAARLIKGYQSTPPTRSDLHEIYGVGVIGDANVALASLGAPPTSQPATRPVFAGVSVQELADVIDETFDKHDDLSLTERLRRSAENILARLDATLVAPVDPEAVAAAILAAVGGSSEAPAKEWKAATNACRATLAAAGIPVTPEVGK